MNIKNEIKKYKKAFEGKIRRFKFNSPVLKLLREILRVCEYKKDVLRTGAIIRSQTKLSVREIFEIKKYKMLVLLIPEIDGYIILDENSFYKSMKELEEQKEEKQ